MKKRTFKSLKLNKKSISNFNNLLGGALPNSENIECKLQSNEIYCDPYSFPICNDGNIGDIVLNTVWENGVPSRCQYSEHPTI